MNYENLIDEVYDLPVQPHGLVRDIKNRQYQFQEADKETCMVRCLLTGNSIFIPMDRMQLHWTGGA